MKADLIEQSLFNTYYKISKSQFNSTFLYCIMLVFEGVQINLMIIFNITLGAIFNNEKLISNNQNSVNNDASIYDSFKELKIFTKLLNQLADAAI